MADVAGVLAGRVPPRGPWDLVLLDVDNGPGFLVHPGNARLYGVDGLAAARSALTPGGVLVVWSSHVAPALLAALRHVAAPGDAVGETPLVVERDGRTLDYALYSLARAAAARGMMGACAATSSSVPRGTPTTTRSPRSSTPRSPSPRGPAAPPSPSSSTGCAPTATCCARLTFVAELDGAVVGSVVCSRASMGEGPSVGLGPLAVHPDHQGQGIGSALVAAVVVTADQRHEPSVVLLGDPGYYAIFGFEPAAGRGIAAPEPWPEAEFQVRPLQAWRPELAGPFRYAPAFEGLPA